MSEETCDGECDVCAHGCLRVEYDRLRAKAVTLEAQLKEARYPLGAINEAMFKLRGFAQSNDQRPHSWHEVEDGIQAFWRHLKSLT